jgi:hypothetical protein
MNRNAIIGAGVVAFVIAAFAGGAFFGGGVAASAIFCALGVAIVLGVAEILAQPGRARQLDALERLAEQGRALPDAADALASAVARLTTLDQTLRDNHAESLGETRTAILASAESTRAAIASAVAEAERTFERVSEAARKAEAKERDETSRVLRDTAKQIREDLGRGVAEAAKASHEAVAPVAAAAMKTATDAATRHLSSIQASVEADATERRRIQKVAVETLDAHLRSVAERLDAQLAHRSDADAKVLIAIEAHARQIRETDAERAAVLATKVEEMSVTLGETLTAVVDHDLARAERFGALAEQIQAELATATTVVRERLEASAESESALERRNAELIETLSAASTTMSEATTEQMRALASFAEAADRRVVEAEDRGALRLADLSLRFAAAAEAQQKRLAVFESELAERQSSGVEALSARLADHARGIDATLRETAGLVREAASLVHAGGGELTAVAEMFAGAVDRQREAANTWIESLGRIDRAVVDAGEHAAVDVLGDYLARTHELFDQQLGFQQELFEQLTVGAASASAPA